MSATVSTPVPGRWLRTLCSGRPHQIISDGQRPYLLRRYLLPPNPWLNLYLHKFVGSDDPGGLHDHPWTFATLILAGSYRPPRQGSNDAGAARWPSTAPPTAIGSVCRSTPVAAKSLAGQ